MKWCGTSFCFWICVQLHCRFSDCESGWDVATKAPAHQKMFWIAISIKGSRVVGNFGVLDWE